MLDPLLILSIMQTSRKRQNASPACKIDVNQLSYDAMDDIIALMSYTIPAQNDEQEHIPARRSIVRWNQACLAEVFLRSRRAAVAGHRCIRGSGVTFHFVEPTLAMETFSMETSSMMTAAHETSRQELLAEL